MKQILVVGGGNIGEVISDLLTSTGEYAVTLADRSEDHLNRIDDFPNFEKLILDALDEDALARAMVGKFAIVSAAPFALTETIARAARCSDVHYFDLTEDVESTALVRGIAEGARHAFVPQCGLAPGFISIVTNDLAQSFDQLDSVRMRVGALPKYPSNRLKYNLTWSTEGIINEYCNPCEAIVDGELRRLTALEGLEEFSLDGTRYEAFNTSGGLGTLCETYAGKVNTLNYRSVRYPGHRDTMKMLLADLKFNERRELLKDVLEYALPVTLQDVVLIFVTINGWKDERLVQDTYANKIYSCEINGRLRSAIQVTTASSVCAVLDMLAMGVLPNQGFIKQEDIPLDVFLANRFGQNYAKGKTKRIDGEPYPKIAYGA